MAKRWFTVLALIVVAAAGVAIAGVGRRCTRPGCLTGIPPRDYQHGSRSKVETSVSTQGMLLYRTPNLETGEAAPGIRIYQLDRAKLQIDHCSISGVVLRLHEDGRWVLNLRADQNPVAADDLLVYHLQRDHGKAVLDAREETLLAYVSKLSERPGDMTEEDLNLLRKAGYDDRAALDVVILTALTYFMVTVVGGLGVETEPSLVQAREKAERKVEESLRGA